jgi:cell division septation protein DedD
MNTQWKQRVVGIVVVIAVATIFMPILFHGSNPLKSTKVAVQEQTEAPVPNIVFKSPSMLTDQNTQLAAANTNNNVASTASNPTANPSVAMQQPAPVAAVTQVQNAVSQQPTQVAVVAPAPNTTMQQQSPVAVVAKPSKIVNQQPTQVAVTKQVSQFNTISQVPAPGTNVAVGRSTYSAHVAAAKTIAAQSIVNTAPQKTAVAQFAKPNSVHDLVLSTNSSVPTAWVLQVGTFGDAINAQRLISKLRSSGYDAYSRESTADNKRLFRVFVGPEINKSALQGKQEKLQANLKINGVLKRYTL